MSEPRKIGRYQVLKVLGVGGMGVVYLAEDPILERNLAVKVVRGATPEQDLAFLRFQREASISARLNHPNIITIYDVGEEPGVGPFLAMEFVDGATLESLIQSNALDLPGRLRVLIQVFDALAAAHTAGVVHRDVKPANVLVGHDGRAKLTDFGIARTDDLKLTVTGAFLGTPGYVAPELIMGGEPGPVTDLYAFTVLAFESLTGCQPYNGKSLSAILYSIANDPPTFPEGSPPRVRALFERALAKDPSARPEAREFLRELIEVAPIDEASRARLRAALPGETSASEPRKFEVGETRVLPQSRPSVDQLSALAPWVIGGAALLVLPLVLWLGRRTSEDQAAPVETVAVAAPLKAPQAPPSLSQPGDPAAQPSARADQSAEVPNQPAGKPVPAGQVVASARSDLEAVAREARGRLTRLGLSDLSLTVGPDGVARVTGMVEPLDRAVIEQELASELGSVEGIARVDLAGLQYRLTIPELEERIRNQLRERKLAHLEVLVASDRSVLLSNLSNRDEEARAMQAVAELGEENLQVEIAYKKAPQAARRRVVSAEPTPQQPADGGLWGGLKRAWGNITRRD